MGALDRARFTAGCSQIEHHALGVRDVAEWRRIRAANELRTPVEILADEARNAVARIDENQRDAPRHEKAADWSGKPHEVVDAARIGEERERQRNRPPFDPAARPEDERMSCVPVVTDNADAPIALVI